MNDYINTWVSIQSIIVGKNNTSNNNHFNKKYLIKDDNDICSSFNVDSCHEKDDGNCIVYTDSENNNSCVNKRRIKRFEKNTISQIFFSKNGKKMKILETNILFEYELNSIMYPLFYYTILDVDTNNIYILFSTGHTIGLFNKYEELIENLKKLVKNIITNFNDGNIEKIILCGHSAGCCLALYTSYLLIKINEDFFNTNCYCVGSGPFKFMDEYEKIFIQDESNIQIFVNGYYITELALYLDPYINIGDGFNYQPFIYIYEDEDEKIFLKYKLDKNLKLLYTLKNLHDWNSYYKKLQHYDALIINDTIPIIQKITRGGIKKYLKTKFKNKKQNLKIKKTKKRYYKFIK
jgi:hypothetical protein